MDDLKSIDSRLETIESQVKTTNRLLRWSYYLIGFVFIVAVVYTV